MLKTHDPHDRLCHDPQMRNLANRDDHLSIDYEVLQLQVRP